MAKIKLTDFINKDKIIFLSSDTKKRALQELTKIISESELVNDKDKLLNKFIDRENIMSTGIGLGIAVPHVKLKSIKDFVVGIGVNKKGIEFDSLDKKKVHIVIMIAAPAHKHSEYLRLLAKIVLVLKNTDIRQKFVKAKKTDDIFNIFKGK